MNVKGPGFVKGFAGFTMTTCFGGSGKVKAIKRFRENTGTGGFANTPRTAE